MQSNVAVNDLYIRVTEIMNVSRQAITKWESNDVLPDVSNLQELSKSFLLCYIDYRFIFDIFLRVDNPQGGKHGKN